MQQRIDGLFGWQGDIVSMQTPVDGAFSVDSQINYLASTVGSFGAPGAHQNSNSSYTVGPNFQFTLVPAESVVLPKQVESFQQVELNSGRF